LVNCTELLIELKLALVAFPKLWITAMHAMTIIASKTAYSTAVGPSFPASQRLIVA